MDLWCKMIIDKNITSLYEEAYHTGKIMKEFGGFPKDHWSNTHRWTETANSLFEYWLAVKQYTTLSGNTINTLELGSGMGSLVDAFSRQRGGLVFKSYGLDISKYAVSNPVVPGLKQVVASVDDVPFKDNSFEIIIALDVLEHIPYKLLGKAALEIERLLRPGGLLFCTIPELDRDGTEDRLESDGVMEHYIIKKESWWEKEFLKYNLVCLNGMFKVSTKVFPFNMSPYNHFMAFIKGTGTAQCLL